MSDTMFDGTIVTWFKKEGDVVKKGEVLAEVATDKANLEIESFDEGTILKLHIAEGHKCDVGAVIATIGQPGEELVEIKNEIPVIIEPPTPEAHLVHEAPKVKDTGDRIKISPLAKNLAKVSGFDYSTVKGSGEDGRIVKRDINVLADDSREGASAMMGKQEALSKMRQAIAVRMVESKTTIPHFYMTIKIVADELVKLHENLSSEDKYRNLTLNQIILKAVAVALLDYPAINARYADENIIYPENINLGIVTALNDGLLIPVLKRVESLSLFQIMTEARALVQRARDGKPKPDDLVGATFCVSNVGKYGVESFSAVIAPGQGAILAVSSITDEAVIVEGDLKPGKVLRLTLSADHRIIDGLIAAKFLDRLKQLLSKPVVLLG